MPTHTYRDFDLQIDQLDDATFRARVLNSPAGQGEVTFALPFSAQELEIFFLRIGRPRRGVRSLNSPEMSEARNFGSKLYDAVFQGGVQACLLRSLAAMGDQGLRIRLRLPPALIDLPWEYLYDSSLARFFSHSTNTPIIRYLDLGQAIRPLAVTPPLNVLVMIASPRDFEALDVEGEWRKIESALAGLRERGLIQLTRLPAATLSALQRQLRQDQYHIFHYIGHGGFDQQTQDGVLLLEDESGRSRLVNGNHLGTLLHDHPSLRLAVLNACEGARTTRSDPFAGVAQQLVRQGIPAVIAMQFEITDRAAILLAQEFYDALADGYPVDGALAEARKSIYTAGNDIEWGTPVLYMRAEDGRLFDVAALPPADEPSVPTTPAAERVSAPTQTRAATIAPLQTDTVEKPPPDQQPRIRWQQPWLIAMILGVLVFLLGVWQRQLIGTWLGWNGAAPAATQTASAAMSTIAAALNITTATPTSTLSENAAISTIVAALDITTATPQPASTATALSLIDPISRTIWLNEGNDALGRGQPADWEIAKSKFEQILAIDPQDVAALLGLGTAQRWLRDKNNALISFAKAVEVAPDDPDANFALGLTYYEEFDDDQRAIDYLSHAIDKSTPGKRRFDMYGSRAAIYASQGQYDLAIADMAQVMAGDPKSEDYLARAGIYRAAGNLDAAAGDYTSAIDLSPSTGKYYLERADFYAQRNQVQQAVVDYDAFLRLRDPQEDQGLIDKAERYLALHAATPTPTYEPTLTSIGNPTRTTTLTFPNAMTSTGGLTATLTTSRPIELYATSPQTATGKITSLKIQTATAPIDAVIVVYRLVDGAPLIPPDGVGCFQPDSPPVQTISFRGRFAYTQTQYLVTLGRNRNPDGPCSEENQEEFDDSEMYRRQVVTMVVQRPETPPTESNLDVIVEQAVVTAIQTDSPLTPTQSQATSTATPTIAPGATRAVTLAPGVEAVFVYVPAGPFTMGSPDGEGTDNEHPQHDVTLDAFWIMQTEVTNAQYKVFVDAGGYTTESYWTQEGWQWRTSHGIAQPAHWEDGKWNQPEYPVVGVSWYEAVAFANWLAEVTESPIRLPSEAEWEKAARGTDGRTYPWGNEPPNEQLLNYGNHLGATTSGGQFPDGASPYDALDMAGNVSEWGADWYADDYYINSPASNPSGPETGDVRVVRGGSWRDVAFNVRAARRGGVDPDYRYDVLGLRLVWSPGF